MSTPAKIGKPLRECLGGEARLIGTDGSPSYVPTTLKPREHLAGNSVLLAVSSQLVAARALIELDGVARRVVLVPPGIATSALPALAEKADANAIISDEGEQTGSFRPRELDAPTEWVLLTSGTSGLPKMIVHTLASLTAPIAAYPAPDTVWGTFYDIRRYGGLQILLRALLTGSCMVLSDANESVSGHLARLGSAGVTHLSGTPSHWRRALMSPNARLISPRYIRLSGEIADQAILTALQWHYLKAAVAHVFASTEAGVAFDVNDGLAGFPASFLGNHDAVELRIENNSLQVRSARRAIRYLDDPSRVLADSDGFVDTGDIVELREGRYYFLGRRDGVINVGGLKFYPEEIEAVINRHPAVHMAVVRARKNPLTGALVSADVVLKEAETPQIRSEILDICRRELAPHKVPAALRCVPSLEVAMAGKLVRSHA